ncbi:MAG TPA: cytochrome c biogenesis protein CcdA [Jiangellales bacterium]|nr:cytochrome c biogenesis protein CcdA [Jiangellales bacterium]
MLDPTTVSLALAAGMLAALNPCGFALLPAYLTLVVARTGDGTRAAALGRALSMTAAMTLGFVAVFGGFGLAVVPLALSLERFLPWATMVIGVGLVGLGAWLLSGRELLLPTPRVGTAPSRSVWSMVGYGVAYAVASLSCTVAPFLAIATSSVTSGGWVAGVGVFVAYALGMGLVVGTLAVAVALAHVGLVTRTRRLLPYVSRASGALLVVAGLYVAYYGWYEMRVLAGGSTEDPLVDAALALQGAASRWVAGLGAGTVAVAFLALLAVGVGTAWLARRHSRVDRESEAVRSS